MKPDTKIAISVPKSERIDRSAYVRILALSAHDQPLMHSITDNYTTHMASLVLDRDGIKKDRHKEFATRNSAL